MRPRAYVPWITTCLFAITLAWSGCSKKGGTDVDDGGDGEDNPPSTVTDLAVVSVTPTSALLQWSAPHGGSATLLVGSYDVRKSASPITQANWDTATEVDGEPAALPVGSQQTMVVTGLTPETSVHFALKSRSAAGIWSDVSNSPTAVLPAQLEVDIPDSSLEAVIREKVQKPTGALLTSDLAEITEIEADEKGIHSLEGLQYCVSLHVLNMRGNAVSDLSPLTNLTGITGLSASGNQITDVGPLTGMTRMNSLMLGDNQITDLHPLQGMTFLNILYLNGNPLSDISPLASLTRLNHLFLAGAGITDISGLSELIYLATLDLGYNAITDLGPLVSNTGIGTGDEIWVAGNPLSEAARTVQIPALRARGAVVHDS
jgi:internalin A